MLPLTGGRLEKELSRSPAIYPGFEFVCQTVPYWLRLELPVPYPRRSLKLLAQIICSDFLSDLIMASTFVAFPKPFALNKANVSSRSNQRLLGSQRSSLRVRAIANKWEPTKVVPQADRVLIRLEELPERSAGGVLLPKSAVKFERYLMGEILSVGTEVGEVEPGKKVLFSDINAYEVDLGTDARHCFCKESDLLAVVE